MNVLRRIICIIRNSFTFTKRILMLDVSYFLYLLLITVLLQ